MTAAQLAAGVWRVPTTPFDLVNSFLLEAPDASMTVVDAGLKRAHGTFLTALAGLRQAPRDGTHPLLGHAHLDHADGAAGVQAATGSRVLSHDREAGYLREGRPPQQDRQQRDFEVAAFTDGPQLTSGARTAVRALLAGRRS